MSSSNKAGLRSSDVSKVIKAAVVTASKSKATKRKLSVADNDDNNSNSESSENNDKSVMNKRVRVVKNSKFLTLIIYSTPKKYDGQLYLSTDTTRKGFSKVFLINF